MRPAGYEPETSLARSSFATLCCWFEPIENAVQEAQRAREGLIAGGDLACAGYTYHAAVSDLLDCAPDAGRLSSPRSTPAWRSLRRTGNEQTGQWLDSYRWLAGVLRGEGPDAAE